MMMVVVVAVIMMRIIAHLNVCKPACHHFLGWRNVSSVKHFPALSSLLNIVSQSRKNNCIWRKRFPALAKVGQMSIWFTLRALFKLRKNCTWRKRVQGSKAKYVTLRALFKSRKGKTGEFCIWRKKDAKAGFSNSDSPWRPPGIKHTHTTQFCRGIQSNTSVCETHSVL